MELNELLAIEKRNFLIKANGGTGLRAAGCTYWLAAGIAGYYLERAHGTVLPALLPGFFPLGLFWPSH